MGHSALRWNGARGYEVESDDEIVVKKWMPEMDNFCRFLLCIIMRLVV